VYALAHSLVTVYPFIGRYVARWGALQASPEIAERTLRAGASVLVYPGGDVEVHRPYRDRHRIVFDGRSGFIRLAQKTGVPLVPVVASGGHDTYLPLSDGRGLAQALKLDNIARLHVLPISLAIPWGLNLGDLFGHLPLPAKIRIELLEPIDVAARFPGERGIQRGYEYVTLRMQEALTGLAAERLLPPLM
jgi:1-acyl-sn-glycerol-3-phosphate acyltransferase